MSAFGLLPVYFHKSADSCGLFVLVVCLCEGIGTISVFYLFTK